MLTKHVLIISSGLVLTGLASAFALRQPTLAEKNDFLKATTSAQEAQLKFQSEEQQLPAFAAYQGQLAAIQTLIQEDQQACGGTINNSLQCVAAKDANGKDIPLKRQLTAEEQNKLLLAKQSYLRAQELFQQQVFALPSYQQWLQAQRFVQTIIRQISDSCGGNFTASKDGDYVCVAANPVTPASGSGPGSPPTTTTTNK